MPLLREKPYSSRLCPHCGNKIGGDLPALAYSEPAYWEFRDELSDFNSLDSDFCTVQIEGEMHYFIRAVLSVPIIDSTHTLDWGVWVSLKDTNYKKYLNVFDKSKKPDDEPYFGWLSNELSGYSETSGLETSVYFQMDNTRPIIVLDHSYNHQLCRDQHNGITIQRAHDLVHHTVDTE